ncbi:peptidoglycan editing factor PgeF [Thalassobacillus devorans]|uniref:peptidoglycan editing factor PgeF n=1 Tax=Thalassobacillus devorans TaxID=279813 RepID=UPI00048BBE97|nr:peptidoglycan editing factor PgeF [Thalassobacillus devorans]
MTEPLKQQNDSLLAIQDWEQDQALTAGFSTRYGGVSRPPFADFNQGLHVNDREADVISNRDRLAASTDIPLKRWVIGEQVHGTEVAVVQEKDAGKGAFRLDSSIEGCDGLITNTPGLLLAAFFADCVPLYFYAPHAGWVGIAHAGWKGSVNGMAASMVKALQTQGVSADEIRAVIGPCISRKHYEVDQRVVDNIEGKYMNKVTDPLQDGKFLMNLRELNRLILLDAGVKETSIHVTGHCTYEQEDVFFSHRRDCGKTGRMLGFIGFTDGKGDV